MQTLQTIRIATAAAGVAATLFASVHLAGGVDAAGKTWSPQAAARHMDERQEWWMKWPKAQRDHGTACVSCHTVLPYAMARATLREQLGEKELTPTETTMLAYVTKRVNAWSDMEPFYNDEHSGPREPRVKGDGRRAQRLRARPL